MKRKLPIRMVLFFAAVIMGFLIAELIVRFTGTDERYLRRNLYFQIMDLKSNIDDPDADILFRMRTGSKEEYEGDFGDYTVSINNRGERGPERASEKTADVFRILCFGGSNVYGAGLNNEETWPAQLERELKKRGRENNEVVNFGTSGYVGIQMAALAWEKLELENPDLIIFGMSNLGAPAFLASKPVERYFRENLLFWDLLLPENSITQRNPLLRDLQIRSVFHSALVRQFFLFLTTLRKTSEKPLWVEHHDKHEERNLRSMRRFLKRTKGQAQSVLFYGPYFGSISRGNTLLEYGKGLKVPVYVLSAEGKSEEYRFIHPPDYVMKWYAKKIADWLEKEKLVPASVD